MAQEIQLQIRGIAERESGHEEDIRDDGPKGATHCSKKKKKGATRRLNTEQRQRLVVDDSGGGHADGALRADRGHPPGPPLLQLRRQQHVDGHVGTVRRRADAGDPVPPDAGALMIGLDNLMYSYALLYLPVSTFSLVAATQLAFNAVTSRLVNAQRFTALIANSVVVLTFSAALLGVGAASDGTAASSHVPRGKYPAGFALTLAASAAFALILSLFELTFDRVVRARTLRWALRMQLCTNIAASAVSVAGLFASGEWRAIPAEMAAFRNGRARYVMTVAGTAVAWQAAAVGTVRLISRVSALFANVTGTVALPLVPVFAVVLFGDRMTGVKAVAMLMALWGFLSYVYQHYLDARRAPDGKGMMMECRVCAARTESDTVSPA